MVSVIVPVYNCEKSLERCVGSILAQTYQNIQCILVDDGSPDGSGALCDELAKKDSRILVIHKENGGPSSARNRGLDAATGKYIQFVDSDDYIDPDMTARMVERMEQQNVQLVACGYRTVYTDREEETRLLDMARVDVDTMAEQIPGFTERYFPNTLWNKLYLAEYMQGRFDESVRLGEDLMFNLTYFRGIRAVSLLDFCPYHYIVDNPQSITGKNGLYRIHDVLVYYPVAAEFYREFGSERNIRTMAKDCAPVLLYSLIGILNSRDYTRSQKRRLVKEQMANAAVAEIFRKGSLSSRQKVFAFFVRLRSYAALRLLARTVDRR